MPTPATQPRPLHKLVTLTIALLGLIAGGTAHAQTKTGTVTLKLVSMQALKENTVPAPEKDAACQVKYKYLLQQEVVNNYSINAHTLIMSASALFKGATTRLYPEGQSSTYLFMSDAIPPELQRLGLMRIVFQIDKAFAKSKNLLLFSFEPGYNCVLTNGLDAASTRELLKAKPKK